MTKLILLTCLASTLFMTGLIWFVHIVHYPLFDRVQGESFLRYHADHTRTTAYVVLLPMVLELLTSIALIWQRPAGIEPWMVWLGLACALVSWASTFFLSVPAHHQLSIGFDAVVHRTLVVTNGIRVVSWSAHSLVLLLMVSRSIH